MAVDRLVAILENLQVPLARCASASASPGSAADVADNFRDKARMKAVFEAAGVPCARSRRVASGRRGADASPPTSASRSSPSRSPAPAPATRSAIDERGQLGEWLATAPPSRRTADAARGVRAAATSTPSTASSIDGQMVWHSISRYLPSPLDVLEHPWIQWCVLLPRDIDGSEATSSTSAAPRAARARPARRAVAHGVVPPADGSVAVSEVGARPPGAQFMTLMSYAHDIDMYAAWAG